MGITLVGEPIEKVYHAIDTAHGIIYIALGLIVVLVVFILLFIGFTVNKVVSKPLHELESAIQGLIESNDTSSRIKVVSDDEIGKVASGFNDYLTHIDNGIKEDMELIKEAEEVMKRVANGCYRQKLTKPTNNQSLKLLKENINNMMDETRERFLKINELLDRYVHYDYTSDLVVEGIEKEGVVEQFIKNINLMKNSITQMLITNKRNGLSLQNSAEDLLKIVSTLNTSSNDAAASLEETAAALEEITSTIKNNNQNVSNMSSYAATVTDAAHKGEELANNTVRSIDEINEQVIAINEAISVIDQIAFQTNILSLNAAVEAATAGESGKGFAVVAQEVRNLASRSAEAAKEIKDIVEETTGKATAGKNIAQQMIQGYTHLNTNINKTIELIKEVETASKEQQNGIVQINDAVNSLDRQTQKNASVATQANDIALSTQDLANEIVADTDEKEFIGKENVQARNISNEASVSSTVNSPVTADATTAKTSTADIKIQKRSQTGLQTIESKANNDEEWASF